jgi:hypothetical protein
MGVPKASLIQRLVKKASLFDRGEFSHRPTALFARIDNISTTAFDVTQCAPIQPSRFTKTGAVTTGAPPETAPSMHRRRCPSKPRI